MGDGMDGETRYYLIACGTKDYRRFGDDEQLPGVEADLRRVIALLTRYFGYERVLPDLDINPKRDDILIKFAKWLQDDRNRRETDIVIFYYAGHGVSIPGDKHFLLLEDTDPNLIGQTALPTEDLVRTLNNDGVRIAQILYIIDTCYSQMGAGEITRFASSSINPYRSSREKNIAVHTLAACRNKQTAKEDVFSQAFEKVLRDFCERPPERHYNYISLDKILPEIKKNIHESMKQNVVHDNTGSEGYVKFFPLIPRTILTWDEQRVELTNELLNELLKISKRLFFINSFLLNHEMLDKEFVLNDLDLEKKLERLSKKPVEKGICPLIACSEWCRKSLLEQRRDKPSIEAIEAWQSRMIRYRENADLDRIQGAVDQLWRRFIQLIDKGDFRLQIEIVPDRDDAENTGRKLHSFHLNMNLWIRNQPLPLGRFAENEKIELNNSEIKLKLDSQRNISLSELIREARYSLPRKVKLDLEFFLPTNFFKNPLEEMQFERGKTLSSLGYEYPVFINSFERYFENNFREIRDEIEDIKTALWGVGDLDERHYYIGTEPSIGDLEKIVESLPIIIWSRNAGEPIGDGDLNVSEWKNWPHKIKELRRQNRRIALFWDDLYPKPSERTRPTRSFYTSFL